MSRSRTGEPRPRYRVRKFNFSTVCVLSLPSREFSCKASCANVGKKMRPTNQTENATNIDAQGST